MHQNEKFANLPIFLASKYSAIVYQLTSNPSEYKLIKTKIDLLESITRICLSMYEKPKAFTSCSTKILERIDERIQIVADFIMEFKECEQQRNDIAAETKILKLMADASVKANALLLDKTGRKLLNDAFEFVRTSESATKKVQNEFSRLTSEAYRYKNASRQMSLSMGYQRGNWTICSVGHTYYAVDYGITMHQHKCPECELQLRNVNRNSSKKCIIM